MFIIQSFPEPIAWLQTHFCCSVNSHFTCVLRGPGSSRGHLVNQRTVEDRRWSDGPYWRPESHDSAKSVCVCRSNSDLWPSKKCQEDKWNPSADQKSIGNNSNGFIGITAEISGRWPVGVSASLVSGWNSYYSMSVKIHAGEGDPDM